MPRPCTVCTHLERAEIDKRLSLQVVNIAQLGREYGLGKDSLRAHRRKHLPEFLPAFTASAAALTLDTLSAEAQRLYLVSLDALAAAERGVLIEVGEDGTEYRKVSSTAIARLLREARAGLGLLAKLAADGAPADEPTTRANAELDSRIAAALDRAVARRDARSAVVDAEVVEEAEVEPRGLPVGGGEPTVGDPTPGGGPGKGGAAVTRDGVPLDSETSSAWITEAQMETMLAHEPTDEQRERLTELFRRAKASGLPVNAATSIDELRAMGVDTTGFTQP